MPKARTAPRGRCILASIIRSMPAPTAISPDVALKDGEVVDGDGWTIEAVTTPGHTANHMAYALKEQERPVRRRSCDGLGDVYRGATGRRDE